MSNIGKITQPLEQLKTLSQEQPTEENMHRAITLIKTCITEMDRYLPTTQPAQITLIGEAIAYIIITAEHIIEKKSDHQLSNPAPQSLITTTNLMTLQTIKEILTDTLNSLTRRDTPEAKETLKNLSTRLATY